MNSREAVLRRRELARRLDAARRSCALVLEELDSGRVGRGIEGLDAVFRDMKLFLERAGEWPGLDPRLVREAMGRLAEGTSGLDPELDEGRPARIVLAGLVEEAVRAMERTVRPGAFRFRVLGLGLAVRDALSVKRLALAAVIVVLAFAGVRIHGNMAREKAMRAASEFSVDFLGPGIPETILTGGLSSTERSDQGSWRWGLGPKSLIVFSTPLARTAVLRYAYQNPIPGQSVAVVVNGERLAVHEAIPQTPWLEPAVRGEVRFRSAAGQNAIEFQYGLWNHKGALFAPGDSNWYAVAFTALSVETK